MRSKGKRIAIFAGAVTALTLTAAAWFLRGHIRFWWRFEPMGLNAHQLPEYRHRQAGIVFVSLPGGTFMMGSPETEEGREDNEGPVHEVTLSPFMIAKYEVTQAEWKAVMGWDAARGFEGATLPVTHVSWRDCQGFCTNTGLHFPTEAQWEYACRAGEGGAFSGAGKLDDMGWYDGNSGDRPSPVGRKAPNGFGLHDMHGNVWELCEDVFDEEFYSKPGATEEDPVCTSSSEGRVIRGGCWRYDAGDCRSAIRVGCPLSDRYGILGFRPAWSSP